jgi:SAM-dependent methyltransferase
LSPGGNTPQLGAVDRVLRNHCVICDGALVEAIDLPALPLTETYCRQPVANPLPGIDQKLLFCPACGHGQLATQLSPKLLYGANYCFRTSASATARKGTQFFLSVLDEVAPKRRFNCVLDLGCNDLHLLSQLKDRAAVRIGIDPVWHGRETEREDPAIFVYGNSIENIPLRDLPAKPDLVICRHTLEHIQEPRAVLETLMKVAAEDALFIFEVPGFDGLISRLRFDQIFHQHLQYFSYASFLRLLEVVGAQFLLSRENFHDWGAMAVAFTRSAPSKPDATRTTRPLLADITRRYALFRGQFAATNEILRELKGTTVYGYGAAQMLPVLSYHLRNDLSQLVAILDDDPEKDGIGYWNLPVKVMPSCRVSDLGRAAVLITAIDNVQPIMTRLLTNPQRPRHIVCLLNII